MAGQSRKWMVVVATMWIQALTGTNFDFSAYSSALKEAMGISQVQLNYLATASDLGKALGWSSGLALLYLPLHAVLLLAAALGLASYATHICWFNTVCFVLCIRNFPLNRSLALSLSISFNGASAAIYALVADALGGGSPSAYLLLNATLPLLVSTAALLPILRQPPDDLVLLPADAAKGDTRLFLVLHLLAFLTGVYLLLLDSVSADDPVVSAAILAGAVALLALPLAIPGVVCARAWAHRTIYSAFSLNVPDFSLNPNRADDELTKELIIGRDERDMDGEDAGTRVGNGPVSAAVGEEREIVASRRGKRGWWWCCGGMVLNKDRLAVLGEEHSARRLIRRVDFWLYYAAYFFGPTVGLVYSNNLGQIAESLGRDSQLDDAGCALVIGTALVGLSSGFIIAAAVTVTSELFGTESVGVNHNILITNIPLGSLLYGQIAALVYDANGQATLWHALFKSDLSTIVCMGKKCYANTFLMLGCITMLGFLCSVALFFRTKSAHDEAERRRALVDGDRD
ncbi:Protein NUCLEAR FUSION DEFECTIVE 4 [Ananas comosus]|uniref:Protein NUCLEAR FUSION DEFECTIVE 4 n=1 Tax=Ananas comosus TaxID=4615 RepID=A0A199V9T6_ANACO|nr:Protein NUCLEAR FUSION DEFECTIVE 4 [Ananas comosus]